HTSWLHRIIESGSKPDDWLTYISYAEQRPHYSDQHSRYRYLFNMYNAALQHISLDENKKNITYAKLHIKFALLQGDEDVEDGRMQFQFARANLRTIALIHIAAAQYELDHGNLAKSRSILRKAKEVEAEPRDLLNKAMQKLLTGDKELYSLEQCGIKQGI
ncbi:dual specificity protein kinase Ttk-like, partial [Saccoglossus kowalevskii]|uniref:Dual specificity protein kinase Ttk-like n=1 Tax=Saccoglossus kowalevskii TaxID=10224 RepID=A0ABM0LY80_SACKO